VVECPLFSFLCMNDATRAGHKRAEYDRMYILIGGDFLRQAPGGFKRFLLVLFKI